ncbi:MAG: GNAT family N-acetyltransferase [Actinomycetota bacterium]
MTETRTDVVLHPYTDADEAETLALLSASLGSGPVGTRSADFFRWKHVENSFGRSFMLVAVADDAIVGLRAFMRWRFRAGGRIYRGVRAVDTATHPDHQGRGIFSKLTTRALEEMKGDADFVFNTPNAASRAGYLKMGWQPVGTFPVSVHVRRPLAFARGMRHLKDVTESARPRPEPSAPRAAEVLADTERVAALIDAARFDDGTFRTDVDVAHLQWRYGAAPSLDYRAVTIPDGSNFAGLAIFRVRSRGPLWETTIAELIARPGDAATTRRLLRAATKAAAVDHVTCRFTVPGEMSRAGVPTGFVPSPVGVGFVVRAIDGAITPDATALGSWSLRLGDLEVF